LVTAMCARFNKKRFPRAAGALLALALAAWPAVPRAQEEEAPPAADNQAASENQAASGNQAGQEGAAPSMPSGAAPVFEVLEVTTGSGSKSRENKPAMTIEIMDLTPKSPEEAAEAARAEAEADPGLNPAQREAKARGAALGTALELWHNRTLSEYSYNIDSLMDPFMPIREVRGRPEDLAEDPDSGAMASLPPILRLELSQLKLVAITTRSGATGSGSALASFEDGAGVSYILRPGDRIGRRQGRITSITPGMVTVEEPAPSPGAPPRVTEIKLSVTDSTGLTRLGGQVDEASPAPPEAGAWEGFPAEGAGASAGAQ